MHPHTTERGQTPKWLILLVMLPRLDYSCRACVKFTCTVCMQALKEVYLPESGVWIAKYPFMDRDVFLDISLDIERERKTQQAAQWPT